MSDLREQVCSLLRSFYEKGWATGTGGGICALASAERLLVAPTGVHKEMVRPQDLFVVDVASGQVVEEASDPALRPSECKGVFRAIVRGRGAGAVLHSHALAAVLACDLTATDELRIESLEMLKGIPGLSNTDVHLVPVISNTPRETDIVGAVDAVLADERFASAFAIGVRDHGAYVWGGDIWECKKHAEVYHFLFEAIRARGA